MVQKLPWQRRRQGLALITVSESQILGGRNREFEPLASLKTSNPVVPPLESTILLFDVAGSTLERGTMSVNSCIGRGSGGNGLFAIDVVYSDSAGAMTYRARFQVVPRDPEPGLSYSRSTTSAETQGTRSQPCESTRPCRGSTCSSARATDGGRD